MVPIFNELRELSDRAGVDFGNPTIEFPIHSENGKHSTVQIESDLLRKYEGLRNIVVADAQRSGAAIDPLAVLQKIVVAHQLLAGSVLSNLAQGQSMRDILSKWSLTPEFYSQVKKIFDVHVRNTEDGSAATMN